ncbi:dienelactone hydrolase [Marinomonas mediterranea]|uniref:Serine aminopeptidase S33 domain-containing protein n=1 Tax=Marinomonas mediterranea (strain ATCC 700492 / JCM 21426 / NBRC 103028 / MMB-1) TaxID=717774 RepID=F2K092_MARM1|nr:alpha/beta hydrolase [Marinomonas mediterranea]ADZ89807.1 hypothetical protein Marme_0511 [Marinomonas mediterranea MMB-1]WCN11991.1 dienelactone hydrolase [Marinomonas mediterranea]WCN16028.1 dienelactone hydrolase [Marinomonas mediterranea MMB-1]
MIRILMVLCVVCSISLFNIVKASDVTSAGGAVVEIQKVEIKNVEIHNVGMQNLRVFSESRKEDIAFKVWYPTSIKEASTVFDSSRIFKGASVVKEANVAMGQYPLIVMSHGSGANNDTLAWLATELAKTGFIVAAPNHPGTTSGDSTPVDTPKLWQRTDDLSLLVGYMIDRWSGRKQVDAQSVGVLGFSLGGAAAMSLVGARTNLEDYAVYCETFPNMADCHWFNSTVGYVDGKQVQMASFDLRQTDKRKFEQLNIDRRIKSAVLVDPSVAQAFDAHSLRSISIPMHFINLGDPETVPVSVASRALSETVMNGRIDYVSEAVHFSFLPECKSGAKAFLERVGETDPLCDEVGSRTRKSIHDELVRLIRSTFHRTL